MSIPLLQLDGVVVTYGRGRHSYTAARDISFEIQPGDSLGMVGESGSGKSSIGRAILGLVTPSAGRIVFGGRDISHASRRERRDLSSDIQVVFQDPRSSLNDAKKIRDILTEPLTANRLMSRARAHERAADLLDRVGLGAAAMDKLPIAFSGGQRQRIAIARAMMPSPRLVICDEPVSALDLSVQAQIINLLRQEQRENGVSYLFIAHDLAVVRLVSKGVVVMSAGRIVEQGPTDSVYTSPRAPYTQRLLAAEPDPDPDVQRVRRARWDQLIATSAG